MQTVSSQFNNRAAGDVRPISSRVYMALDKSFDPTIDFATVGISTVGSRDIIAGTGSVLQEWDQYEYTDYSDRVLEVEWTRSEDQPYSVVQATADIVFDNSDGTFSPNQNADIKPRRPVRIYAGFGSEDVQVFVGLTEGMPKIDEPRKTATFHCIDFLSWLFEKPLQEVAIYQNQRIDEIMADLLETNGLTSLQHDLDLSFNTVPFAFFDKDMKLGDAIRKLTQADLGSFFMTEDGVVRFRNRQGLDTAEVMTFDNSNILSFGTREEDDIINVVEVESNVREVQDNQKVWDSTEAIFIPAGGSETVVADFSDPVTGIDEPELAGTATTSVFAANLVEEGEGTNYTDIELTSFELFSKSYVMVFENTGSQNAYLRSVQLFGTPAKVAREVFVREQDDTSVDEFEEQPYKIDNEYIQDRSTAQSLALTTLAFFSDLGAVRQMVVKGNPALQLGDPIALELLRGFDMRVPVGLLLAIVKHSVGSELVEESHYITKVACQITPGQFKQTLDVRVRNTLDYARVGITSIGNADVIAP